MNRPIPDIELSPDWRQSLRDTITDGAHLLQRLDLKPAEVGLSESAARDFPVKVPPTYLRQMKVGDPCDPLLRQVLAHRDEMQPVAGFNLDPVGETDAANPRPGIIHKYRGRVLLIVTGACAVHCRYCFRRHFPYDDNSNSRAQWRETLKYVRRDDSISEVILSGGDPLVVGDDQLRQLIDAIAAISHIKRLRIHSRIPVVMPERITEELLRALCGTRLQTVMVTHCNHANEISGRMQAAVTALRDRDILSLNQAVLLAGVNDSIDAQVALNEGLFAAGVLPYYLHLLDRVAGAAHYEVDERRAVALHREMTARLPGYLVPKLVREIEGADAKTSVNT